MIFLNYLFRGKTSFQFLEIDYSTHFFFPGPLRNLDALVVFGSSIAYWGLGFHLLLTADFRPGPKNSFKKGFLGLIQFLAEGFLTYYFLLLFCCWLLALYEGYIPLIFDDAYFNHGPWHFISHLKLLIFLSYMPIFLSLILSMISFLIKFNIRSFMLIVINLFVFGMHLYLQIWLID